MKIKFIYIIFLFVFISIFVLSYFLTENYYKNKTQLYCETDLDCVAYSYVSSDGHVCVNNYWYENGDQVFGFGMYNNETFIHSCICNNNYCKSKKEYYNLGDEVFLIKYNLSIVCNLNDENCSELYTGDKLIFENNSLIFYFRDFLGVNYEYSTLDVSDYDLNIITLVESRNNSNKKNLVPVLKKFVYYDPSISLNVINYSNLKICKSNQVLFFDSKELLFPID